MKGKLKYIVIAIALLIGIFGVSYAFYEFYDVGDNNQLIVGNIYLKLNDGTDKINLSNVFPMTAEEARAREDNIVTFTISGLNTTTDNDIYYEIMLNEGDSIEGKNRAKPEHLVFDLVEIDENGKETIILNARSFKELDSTRVYINTVSRDVIAEINRTYKLRMWLSDDVLISDTNPDADYSTSVFSNSYASVKVSVFGDFNEKTTDASCFAYNVIVPDGYIAYDYPIITLDTSEEKVEACMVAQMNVDGTDISTAQDGYQSFCEGTGAIDFGAGEMNLNEYVNFVLLQGSSKEEAMQDLPVVTDITSETRYYELNTSEESVNACKEYMLTLTGEDGSDAQDGYQSYCEGTGTIYAGYSIFDDINNGNHTVYSLIERNILTQVETPQGEIEITNYDEETCGTNIIIPSTIEGLPVTRIADERSGTPATQINVKGNNLKNNTLYNKNSNYGVTPILGDILGVFELKNITSVKFPNTLKYIGTRAFNTDLLSEVIIPDSVSVIRDAAFSDNNITNVEIGTGITSIGHYAFNSNPLVTVNIKNNPTLGEYSFGADYPSDFVSPIGAEYLTHFKVFQYAGTCAELNQYENVFYTGYAMPQQIITSDTNSCTYTGPATGK